MTWAELRGTAEQLLREAGRDNPPELARHWLEDAYRGRGRARAERPTDTDLVTANQQLAALCAGVPLAYVTGLAHFYGLQLHVDPAVLIPRPETEELVRWVLESEGVAPLHFVDLCTGSGCIAAALAYHRQAWRGLAVDISSRALAVAERNLTGLSVDRYVRTRCDDVLAADNDDYLGVGGEWDLIVSNPPYIPDGDWLRVDPAVAAHEPHLALRVSGDDPLAFYRAIEATARRHLRVRGRLYVECNDRYAGEVAALLRSECWSSVEILRDMQGRERHVRGRRPLND